MRCFLDVLFPEALELFVRHLGFGFIHHAVVSIAGNVSPDKISNSLISALLDGILQDSPATFVDSVRERFAVVRFPIFAGLLDSVELFLWFANPTRRIPFLDKLIAGPHIVDSILLTHRFDCRAIGFVKLHSARVQNVCLVYDK